MPSNEKPNLYSKVIIALLFAISVIFGFLLYQNKTKVDNLDSALNQRIAEMEQVRKNNLILGNILEIEEAFFNDNDYEKALGAFRKLLDSVETDNEQIIEQRISNLELIMATNGESLDELQRFKFQLNKERQILKELEQQKQSEQKKLIGQRDSLNNALIQLKSELIRKEKEVSKKEKVQVITFKSSKGNKIYYLGEVENNKANGGGVGIWSTGSVYKGDWLDNLRHGKGIYEWEDGVTYEGDFNYGKREGQGIYKWPSGERYEGEWKDDKRNGQGTLFDIDGNIRYKGIWQDDKPLKG